MSDNRDTTGDSKHYSDVHVHLQSHLNPYGAQTLLDEACRVGVDRFVCSGTSPDDWDEVLLLAFARGEVYPTLGVHPWYVDSLDDSWKTKLWQLCVSARARNGRRPAAGEIGLDFSLPNANKVLQEKIFALQLDLATDQQLPVILHCVRASGVISTQLERLAQVPLVLFHAFSESREIANQWARHDNFYFSFRPEHILSPSPKVLAAIQTVPVDRILLETDQPGPLRNQLSLSPNENSLSNVVRSPALIPLLAQALARLRNIETGDFLTLLRRNEDRFFAAWPDSRPEGAKP
ncbi:MAG: TatD family hydrolase [Thermoguttaceae bacterium]|nr:TatD family hydrolase [Thermoguttaceae bacterium]